MDELKALDLDSNTVVVFSSDHGPGPYLLNKKSRRENRKTKKGIIFNPNMLGSTDPLRGCKHSFYEGGMKEALQSGTGRRNRFKQPRHNLFRARARRFGPKIGNDAMAQHRSGCA